MVTLEKVDSCFKKALPLFAILGVAAGLIFKERVAYQRLSTVILCAMTFSSSLSLKPDSILATVKKPKILALHAALVLIIIPLATFLAAPLIISDRSLVQGCILFSALPSAIMAPVWCGIYAADMAVSLTILLLNTFLSPFFTAQLMRVFGSAEISFNTAEMSLSLLTMVVIPALAAMVLNTIGDGKPDEKLSPYLSPLTKIGTFVIIMITTGKVASSLPSGLSGTLLLPSFVIIFTLSLPFPLLNLLQRPFSLNEGEKTALAFGSSMRNNALGAVIATRFFDEKTAIPILISIILQQIVTAANAKIFLPEEK